ncbi:MAG: hypothetical protein ABSE40_18735 [Candidatus Sulfotelmatobacter sp.]
MITNAVNIATELGGARPEVILTGGMLRKNSFSLVGPIAEETLHRLNADILFLGVDGFDVQYGLSTPNLLKGQPSDGRHRQAGHGRVRFKQGWTKEPVLHCFYFCHPPSHHRPANPTI